MTLLVAAISKKSIWLLTDRRLSDRDRTLTDNACKLLLLDTTDGVALLGYAGLGSTALGTEPCDWMARVLRGLNLPLEQSLRVLAGAVRTKIPGHLGPIPAHHVVVPAFLNGDPKIYSIDIVRPPGHANYFFRFTRHVSTRWHLPPRAVGIVGSGAVHLSRDRKWVRTFLKILAAHDAGRIAPQAVASYLARVNYQVSTRDKSVGPRCIVAWRFKKGGGGQIPFSGLQREVFESLPTMACGHDVLAMARVIQHHVSERFAAMRRGESNELLDNEAMNAELAKLPNRPDDTLA